MRELLDRDPRPIRDVLRDATHLADCAMADTKAAIVNGDTSVDAVGRLLEATRYVTAVATAALVCSVAGELLERLLFFTTASAPR